MKQETGQILDTLSVERWNEFYNISKTETLWSGNEVPFVRKAIEHFKIDSGSLYLDLPCGEGRNTVPLAQSLAFVVGADTASRALNLADKRIRTNKVSNCLLLQANIFATGFGSDQFDGIFCWDVLGHLARVEEAIIELLRILKPKRKLVGSIFAMGDSTRGSNMERIGDEEYLFDGKIYFRYYDQKSVISLLEYIGAKIIFLETTSWDEPPHEGYREYPHNHESWAFVLEKQ